MAKAGDHKARLKMEAPRMAVRFMRRLHNIAASRLRPWLYDSTPGAPVHSDVVSRRRADIDQRRGDPPVPGASGDPDMLYPTIRAGRRDDIDRARVHIFHGIDISAGHIGAQIIPPLERTIRAAIPP